MNTSSTDSSADEIRIDSAIADYLDAVQADASFDERLFLEQHADIAEALQEFLANRQHLAQMAGALGPDSDSVLGREASVPALGTALKYFGDYLLLEEIARGGMGVIYKARQTKLNRVVAVKLILAGQLAAKDTIDRFYVEAKSAARLTHPNIVAIHEVGQHDDQHYFSMDYVQGESLSELVRHQPLPVYKSVEYVKAVAAAIHYAHTEGVLHRDLKPSNILIDLSDQPRITDFGLAKHVTDDPGLTATGQILGTPSYMPPEQALGNHKAIGPASDVYALGAVLYELLTGRPPFLAATAVETILQARQREVIAPSLLNPSVSRDLETICLKCLQKEPQKRYVSASDLADDLQRYQAREPIHARPIGNVERSLRWCQRNPAFAALMVVVAALMVVMLLAIVGVSSQWMRAEYFRVQEYHAKIQAQNAESAAERNARLAQDARLQALKHATAAREQAESADHARQREARNLYIAHMNLAAQAFDEGNFRRAASLLSNYDGEMRQGDLRGFEWYYLWQRVNLAGEMTFNHGGRLYTVAVTPDGRSLLTAGNDTSIKIWDLETGQLKTTCEGHELSVTSIAIAPDGNHFCSASHDTTIRLWDLASGELVASIDAGGEGIRQLTYGPNGKTIVAAGFRGTIGVYDVAQAERIRVLSGHEGLVFAVAVSPDGKTLVSSGVDATIRWWDLASGENVRTFIKEKRQRAFSIVFSPDGKYIVMGTSDDGGAIELWDVASGEKLSQLVGHTGDVFSVCFSPDGRTLASSSQDQSIRLWDVETRAQEAVYRGHAGQVRSVAFLPDGTGFVSGAFDGIARLWRLDDSQHQHDVLKFEKGVLAVVWSPDGQTVALSGWGAALHLIDAKSGRLKANLEGLTESVFRIVFLQDGELLATAGRDKQVQLWQVDTGTLVHTFPPHDADIRGLAWSAQHGILAAADRNGLINFWDVENRKLIRSHQHLDDGKPSGINDLAFSPDGESLALIGRYVKLFNMTTGEEQQVGGRGDAGVALAFSSQGELLVANREELAWLWSSTGKRTMALRGHAGAVNGVAFSPDGRQIATASEDHTVKLWDAATGEQVGTLRGHTKAATCLAFSPDGNTLISGAYDGTLHFWRAADAVAAHNVTAPNTSEYFAYQSVENAVAKIKQLGGRVVRDQNHPDQPVINVYLTGSDVDDNTLALLGKFTELKLLSLFNTNATGEGLKHLTDCKQLESLTMMGTAVNDVGVAMIARFPALTNLSLGMGIQPLRRGPDGQPISLTEDPITDAALPHLANLKNLYYLAFDNTQISNAGLPHLDGLTGLQQLQFFRSPYVTEAGLAGLRLALPKCEMDSYDQAQPDEPHYAARLVVAAGRKGEDSPSSRVGLGRLANNSFIRTGETRCGPASSLATVSWTFKQHVDGVDVYMFEWTLTRDGEIVKSETAEVRFNGERAVLFNDEHYIFLDRPAPKRAPRNKPQGQADTVETDTVETDTVETDTVEPEKSDPN